MSLVLLLAVVMMSALLLFGAAGCSDNTAPPKAVSQQQMKSMTKSQVESLLQKLERQNDESSIASAMCYKMAMPPATAEYLCPACGEKTLYSKDDAYYLHRELDACRRAFKELKQSTTLSLALDESSLCAKCSPKAKKHELSLIVRYPDGGSHVTTPISHYDLRILGVFLAGKSHYPDEVGISKPLKPQLGRLMELLGINESTAAGK